MATFSLAVDNFHHGDDFDAWVKLFETAVSIAHNVEKGDALDKQCLAWLPLKLDDTAQRDYESVKSKTWAEVKVEFSKLLHDPHEKYNWLSGKTKIIWDGKESFQSLSARIKRRVDKSGYTNGKEEQYFFAFREALSFTGEYQKNIDLHCGSNWSLEEAMKIANRLRLADGNVRNTASFSAAAMVDHSGAAVGTALRKSTTRARPEKLRRPNISARFGSCYDNFEDDDDQFEDADLHGNRRDGDHSGGNRRGRDHRDGDRHYEDHRDGDRHYEDHRDGDRHYEDRRDGNRHNSHRDGDHHYRDHRDKDHDKDRHRQYYDREGRRYEDDRESSQYDDTGREDHSSDEDGSQDLQSQQQDHCHYGAAKFSEKKQNDRPKATDADLAFILKAMKEEWLRDQAERK